MSAVIYCYTIIGIVPPVMAAVSHSRLNKLKKAASRYWSAKGVEAEDLKNQPLGEFYVKRARYGELMKYRKFMAKAAKKKGRTA